MGKLIRRITSAEKALATLEEILKEPHNKIVRDAGIQRFEYTFEIFWKLLKEFLYEHEGIVCNSPKSCFKEAFSIGLCNEDETIVLLEMTDSRNLTSHTYDEELAEKIFANIPQYLDLMKKIFRKIKE